MIPSPGTTLFLAAEIADALGVSPRAIRRTLAGVPPAGYKEVRGQQTPAWTFAILPRSVRQRLEQRATQASFRDAQDLLANSAGQWEPEIPLTELESSVIEKASRLREVLASILRADGARASISDLTRAAHRAFARVHGYELRDERSVRRWIERAQRRDRGRGEFERIELYFDDRLTRRIAVDPARQAILRKPSILRDALRLLGDTRQITLADKDHLWDAVMEEIDHRIQLGQRGHVARAEVVEMLAACGVPLAATRAGLEKNVRRRYQRHEAGDSQADRRPQASGHRRKPVLGEAQNLLLARTLNCGGRVSQAYRELWDEGRLPAAFYHSYTRDSADKSRVPKQIRDLFPPDFIAEMQKHHIGPKKVKLRGPKTTRDWSQMPSGVQAQSDDCTLPVYFWITLDDGSFKLLRGQFLPYIDTRTTYIYCFQLLAKEGYGSVDLGRGLLQLNDNYGIPEEVYYERGIWKKSLIISGRGDEVPWKDRVYGLKDLGIKVIHALDPSAKVVEGTLGILQNRMERERGYCGRDERKDCPEAVAQAKRWVESGKCHPSEFFYSHTEWVERLNKICDAYNDEVQHGKKLNGVSPRQAFVQLQQAPPVRLDEATRYLLASHRRIVTVTARGLTIRIGATSYTYKSEATGKLIGQKVLAWFDLEDPELITLTTLDSKNPVTVKRETILAAWRAPKDSIAQAKRENAAHMAPARHLYSTLKKEFPEEFGGRFARRIVADEATRELGAAMGAQKAEIKAQDARTHRTRRAVRESSRRAGFELPSTTDPRRLDAQKRLADMMRQAETEAAD